MLFQWFVPPIIGVQYYTSAHYGQGSGPILLDDVACSGLEVRLADCLYESNTMDCSHSEDVGIMCQPCESHNCFVLWSPLTSTMYNVPDSCRHGEVRLAGGQSVYSGRVEVCLTGRWGTVSDSGWSTANTQVVCTQLGYNSLGYSHVYTL